MAINLPDWFADVRSPVEGDSFGWAGIEPAAAKKSIVIHHSGSLAGQGEDAFSIARYHVEHNGWGGIGYHLVITHDKDGPVRVQYAGDLETWRAHVLNQNPGRVGICLVGNFEQELPGEAQLHKAREVIDLLLAPNNILPSLNYYSQVLYHNAVPDQSTGCPGWQGANFNDWFSHLTGGAFPTQLYSAPPAPAPVPSPAPEPVPAPAPEPTPLEVVVAPPPAPEAVTPPPAPPIVDARPEWERSWTPQPAVSKSVVVPSADVIDFGDGTLPPNIVRQLAGGDVIDEVVGYFTVNGVLYARTQWAVDNNRWNGIAVGELRDLTPDPTPSGSILADLPHPPEPTIPVREALGTLLGSLLGAVLSPLRLGGWLYNKIIGGVRR